MAKAVTRTPGRRVPVSPGGGGDGGRVGYLRGVWEELKKVIWPTPQELWRMTGIVIATVVLFALLIGGADYVLGLVVKQVYTTSSNTTTNTTQTTPTKTNPTAIPTAAPVTSSAPTVSP